jgi:hypothetical protein
MSEESIPADLRDFILRYIDSVAQLEALLLLYWEKSTNWTANMIVEAEGEFSFRPKAPEHEQIVEQLANAYSARLIPITNLIHSKPARIREFSDAFKLRRDRT